MVQQDYVQDGHLSNSVQSFLYSQLSLLSLHSIYERASLLLKRVEGAQAFLLPRPTSYYTKQVGKTREELDLVTFDENAKGVE